MSASGPSGPLVTYMYVMSHYENDPDFMERVVRQYETWIHHFDPESMMQSKQ